MSTENKNLADVIEQGLNELRTKTDEGFKDVVRSEELERIKSDINSQITSLQEAIASQNAVKAVAEVDEEHLSKAAAVEFFTRGNTAFERGADGKFYTKALGGQAGTQASLGFASDGGALLPKTFGDMVDGIMRKQSPVRGMASVRPGGLGYVTPFKTSKGTAGVRTEFGALATSNVTQFDTIAHTFYEVNTTQPISVWAAQGDVRDFDLLGILVQDIADALAEQDGSELMLGTHQNQKGSGGYIQNGLLNQTKLVAGVDKFTNVVGSLAGVETVAADAITADDVINMLTVLHARYDNSTSVLTSKDVQKTLLTAKDTQGRYLLTIGSVQDGFKPAIWGKTLVTDDYMPAFADAVDQPILIAGDFKSVVIVDAAPISWIVDPLTNKAFIQYTARFRTSSSIVNYNGLRACYKKHAS